MCSNIRQERSKIYHRTPLDTLSNVGDFFTRCSDDRRGLILRQGTPNCGIRQAKVETARGVREKKLNNGGVGNDPLINYGVQTTAVHLR